jgi:hypothetical protein
MIQEICKYCSGSLYRKKRKFILHIPLFRTVRCTLAGFHVLGDGIIIKDIWSISGIAEGGCQSTKKIDKTARSSGLMTLA